MEELNKVRRVGPWFSILIFLAVALLAAISPFVMRDQDPIARAALPWPETYEGKQLHALPLTDKERIFIANFPGAIGRFTDGKRELIIRQVNSATRMLHPAADCFRGIGFDVVPVATRTNNEGVVQACFEAHKSEQSLRVCEHINDAQRRSWPDVGSWYWHALKQSYFGDESRTWWSFVVAEHIAPGQK